MAAPMVKHAICQNFRLSTYSDVSLYCCIRKISLSPFLSRKRKNLLPLRQGRQPRKVLYMNEAKPEADVSHHGHTDSAIGTMKSKQSFIPVSATQWPYAQGRPPAQDITSKVTNLRNVQDAWKESIPKINRDPHLRIGTIQKPQKRSKGKRKFDGSQQPQNLDDLDEVHYELLNEGDKRFGEIVMTAKSRKLREKKGIILLEGHRLIMDAILAGAIIECLYFTKLEHLEDIPLKETDAALYKVRYQHMKIWSDLETPPGIMAICQLPKSGELEIDRELLYPITLICDNIRDPGNMGTILRAAAAVGCQSVLATTGCVDIWSPKVLRAGAGCHFRTTVINNLTWPVLGTYIDDKAQVFLADSNYTDIADPQPLPSASVAERISEDEGDKYIIQDEETGQSLHVDESYQDNERVELYKQLPLTMSHYFDAVIDNRKSTVLVIGGETEGLSAAAHKLAVQKDGEKLVIPMNEGIDSLNAAMAASIILFDMKMRYMVHNHERAEQST